MDKENMSQEVLSHGIHLAKKEIKNLIHTIRGQQVMLDSDLAALYQVETRVFNQAVNRNARRFPETFRFRLTRDEYENLISQIVTSSEWGGRRKLPYAFTEQGVAMLSGILRSDIAIDISVQIMNAFVQMRRFLSDNAGLLQRMDIMETRQLEYKRQADERFEQIFGYLETHGKREQTQMIFFDGQIYDAFELFAKLIKKAEKEIVLIDSYVALDTLSLLAKKHKTVNITVFTTERGNRLTKTDVEKFNAQYPQIEIKNTNVFHDRFLIIDGALAYHIGASLKDAGKKCFGISQIEDDGVIQGLLERLEKI